jgi:hypothetical protein
MLFVLWAVLWAFLGLLSGPRDARAAGHVRSGEFKRSTLLDFCAKGLSDSSEDVIISNSTLSMEGRGQHRVLWYRFDYADSFRDESPYRDVMVVHTLPTVWFVDPFQAKRLVGDSSGSFESIVWSDVDLESIEVLSRPVSHALVGRVDVPVSSMAPASPSGTSTSLESSSSRVSSVELGIKVHARYAKVSMAAGRWGWLFSDVATVSFEPFDVVVRSRTGHCRRLVPALEGVLEAQLPAGAARHWDMVRAVTTFVLLGAFWYVWTGCVDSKRQKTE